MLLFSAYNTDPEIQFFIFFRHSPLSMTCIYKVVVILLTLGITLTLGIAFPNSAGFLHARLASGISLSFSKNGAVDVELGILFSPALFSCSRTKAYMYLSGLSFMNLVY